MDSELKIQTSSHLTLILFVAFYSILVVVSANVANPVLWGVKDVALFDVWCLQHLLSGFILGFLVGKLKKIPTISPAHVIGLIVFAYTWEAIEYNLETSSIDNLRVFIGGIEYRWNRILVDPLFMVIGFYLSFVLPLSKTKRYTLVVFWLSFALIHIYFGNVTHFHNV